MEKQLTKKNTIHDALVMSEETAEVFLSYSMHCVGCPSRSGETIEQAAIKHGASPDEMLEKLNAVLGNH